MPLPSDLLDRLAGMVSKPLPRDVVVTALEKAMLRTADDMSKALRDNRGDEAREYADRFQVLKDVSRIAVDRFDEGGEVTLSNLMAVLGEIAARDLGQEVPDAATLWERIMKP